MVRIIGVFAKKKNLLVLMQVVLISTFLLTIVGGSPTGVDSVIIEPSDIYLDYVYLYESDEVEVRWQVIEGGEVSFIISHKISEDEYVHLVFEMGTKSGSLEKVVKQTGLYTIQIQNWASSTTVKMLLKINVERGLEGALNSISGYDTLFLIITISLGVIFLLLKTKVSKIKGLKIKR